jgi:hypothetical protein
MLGQERRQGQVPIDRKLLRTDKGIGIGERLSLRRDGFERAWPRDGLPSVMRKWRPISWRSRLSRGGERSRENGSCHRESEVHWDSP